LFAPYSKAITVIDVRQGRLQRIIGRILSNLSGDTQINRYIHLDYEIVSLSGKTVDALGIGTSDKRAVSMSGRRGIYVNADDVLDAVHRKAYDETKRRNPDEDDAWLHGTAEKIAVAAIRFELLKQDLDKTITFDLERALDLEGETGPYLQYAYARSARIMEKAGNISAVNSADISKLTDPSEAALVKEISKFDVVVEDVVKNLAPKVLARYLYNTVSLFNTFYEKMPVLKEPDESTKFARLTLVKAFQTVVKNGLNLLGIETPDRI
jgi:arginyl-tRNA synthetase